MQWQKFVAEFFLTLVDSKNVVRKGTVLRYGMFLEEYSAENDSVPYRSRPLFKAIPQLFSTIEIVSAVVTIEQHTIFRSDLLFLFNNLNIFLMNSNSVFRVQVRSLVQMMSLLNFLQF